MGSGEPGGETNDVWGTFGTIHDHIPLVDIGFRCFDLDTRRWRTGDLAKLLEEGC